MGFFLYKNDTHVDVNMTDIHKSSVAIQKEYLSGKDVSAIEKEYDCSVIFETSRSYEEELWQAIGNGSIVLDLRDDSEMIIGKMIFSEQEAAYSRDRIRLWIVVAVVCGTVILMGYVLLIYTGQSIVKPFDKMQAHDQVMQYIQDNELNMGQVLNSLRIALVGTAKGPELFTIIDLLGVEEVHSRIMKAIQVIEG